MTTIVHVNKAYPPEMGGVETVCRQYAELSIIEFDTVHVLTIGHRRGFGVSNEDHDLLKIRRCDYQFRIVGHKFSLQLMFLLWRYCLARAVIHLHDPFPLASIPLLLAWRPRLIVTYHSDIVKQKWLKRPVDMIRRATLLKAAIITVTSSQLQQNSNVIGKLRASRQVVLPPFLDDTSRYKEPVRRDSVSDGLITVTDGLPFLLMVGRMCYYKGLEVVLAALERNQVERHQNVLRIVIAGPNIDKQAELLSSELQSHDSVVRIDRSLTEIEKIFLLQSCMGLLFPSNKPTEAFGIVQLEALAAGKPIVNCNLPTGVPSVSVHGKTGLTFEVNDHVAVADLLAGRSGHFDRLRQITSRDIEKQLDKFSRERLINVLVDCYQSIKCFR